MSCSWLCSGLLLTTCTRYVDLELTDDEVHFPGSLVEHGDVASPDRLGADDLSAFSLLDPSGDISTSCELGPIKVVPTELVANSYCGVQKPISNWNRTPKSLGWSEDTFGKYTEPVASLGFPRRGGEGKCQVLSLVRFSSEILRKMKLGRDRGRRLDPPMPGLVTGWPLLLNEGLNIIVMWY